ncbi:MAG: tRNA (N6-threonylcarbamoyladenosine(37)-N6)-methyltransferase TrmO [Dehalococcoidia bacterium]|nr:tRNA (N6-threonylcarbamoyladenosine(37)-N6)-methyltransferase TrmO [Dehalococcoidia bacterium]
MTYTDTLELRPIGIIHSPYREVGQVPIQNDDSGVICEIEVFEEYEAGLQDVEGFSHIVVIFWFHKLQDYKLLVKPPGEDRLHGVFATRSPRRPCPLGLTVAELLSRDRHILRVKGLDAIDGTPLLDIKPYLPGSDDRTPVRVGWLESRKGRRRN